MQKADVVHSRSDVPGNNVAPDVRHVSCLKVVLCPLEGEWGHGWRKRRMGTFGGVVEHTVSGDDAAVAACYARFHMEVMELPVQVSNSPTHDTMKSLLLYWHGNSLMILITGAS